MEESTRRRNTIVICSDEHHPRYAGYAGHPYVKTPNLDALAEGGVAFEHAYCSSPVCTPSRMSFITGKYCFQIGSWFIGCPLDEGEPTWPSRLSDASVHTAMMGKMDFCGPYQSGGFDEYRIIERRGMFEPYPRVSPLASKTPGYVRDDKLLHLKHSGVRAPLYTNGSDGHNEWLGFYDHDRVVTEWGLDFLRQRAQKPDEEPWVLYLGYLMPHWPYICPEEYFNMYYPELVEMPFDCVMPENPALHPALRGFQRGCNFKDVTDDDIRRALAAYCGMITCMDSMFGQIFDELRAQGIFDDVNILYTSDHGDSCGEHGLFFKQCSYEGSVGVPLIMKGPDMKRGHVVHTPVTLVDMYPTLLSLYGLESEPDRPGSSWLPLLEGGQEYGMNYAFSEHHGNFFQSSWFMLVKDGYKYTYYTGHEPTLFCLDDDPREMCDLAGRPDQRERLGEFERLLRTIVDPEAVWLNVKQDLGMIGPNGEDYTECLTYKELLDGYGTGQFVFQPEFTRYGSYGEEH